MSDDDDDAIQITRGGAIAVDTGVLRSVAARLGPVALRVGDAADAAYRAHRWIVQTTGLSAGVDTVQLWAVADRLTALRIRIDEVIYGTALMSDAYELVEMRSEYEALQLSDAVAAEVLLGRIQDVEARDSRLGPMADCLIGGWEDARYEGLDGQFDLATTVTGQNFGALTSIVAGIGGSTWFGRLPPGAKASGDADPVHVRPVQTSRPVTSPASLADGLRRMPEADDAQIKVETYTFDDGSKHYVAYIKGTQSGLYGAGEPWDMKSNLELYTGNMSASYQATIDALHLAGAQPGEPVDIYAHSQGGMVASYLAMADDFDVRVVVTAGSPLEPSLRDDQLLIQLRHTDDLVNGLAGGGSAGGTGSENSLVVQRQGDPLPSILDLVLEPHMMDNYIETAEMVDDSGDVRLGEYLDHLRELAAAVTVESTEYAADRTGWSE